MDKLKTGNLNDKNGYLNDFIKSFTHPILHCPGLTEVMFLSDREKSSQDFG